MAICCCNITKLNFKFESNSIVTVIFVHQHLKSDINALNWTFQGPQMLRRVQILHLCWWPFWIRRFISLEVWILFTMEYDNEDSCFDIWYSNNYFAGNKWGEKWFVVVNTDGEFSHQFRSQYYFIKWTQWILCNFIAVNDTRERERERERVVVRCAH